MIPLKMMMTMKTMMMMMSCQILPFPVAWPLASGHLHFYSNTFYFLAIYKIMKGKFKK
jgi:hypothetical protein